CTRPAEAQSNSPSPPLAGERAGERGLPGACAGNTRSALFLASVPCRVRHAGRSAIQVSPSPAQRGTGAGGTTSHAAPHQNAQEKRN
ncbi:MAG: hypothetical protein AVDCRST_MAG89-2489, partial [uncultured Gemmatimonadetes bacterium]